MQRLAYLGARIARRVARQLEQLGDTQRLMVQQSMTAHDMAGEPDETYYRDQYWRWLLLELQRYFPERAARVLDIGCGQGRLALPLAAWLRQGQVTGIDLTPAAVEQARRYAQEQGLTNVEFQAGDALTAVQAWPAATCDLALMTEVSFFMPAYRAVITAAARALRPGGVFFASFRSQYFDLLYSVHARDWASARLARDAREGHWGGGTTWFSWQTVADVRQVLAQAGLAVTSMRGIGIASGIEGDPLALIVRPSQLDPAGRAQLMELETSLAEEYAGCGRYILAVAVKPAD